MWLNPRVLATPAEPIALVRWKYRRAGIFTLLQNQTLNQTKPNPNANCVPNPSHIPNSNYMALRYINHKSIAIRH